MTITKQEFEQLMDAALIGFKTMVHKSDEIKGRNVVAQIQRYIDQVDEINGKDAEHISIDVCANK